MYQAMKPYNRRAVLGLLAAGLLAALLPVSASACRCTEPVEIKGPYSRSHAIVLAKAARVTPNPKIDGFTVELQVREAWKNSVPAKLTIETGTDCRYPFEVDKEYLVVVLKGSAGYSTGRCMGNRSSDEAHRAIEWLNAHGARAKVE